jgi:UDPglucose 6-dehydrogenase
MKIAIVGYGFVGKAASAAFSLETNERRIIDPKLEGYQHRIESLPGFDPDVTFVCVPTPMGPDGAADYSIVRDVMNYLKNNVNGLIVLKSTVLPEEVRLLCDLPRTIYNPEFLRERSALSDFLHPEFHVIGCNDIGSGEYLLKIYEEHSLVTPCVSEFMTPVEASLVKYAINSFLATKVMWFNQFQEIVKSTGSSYDKVIRAVTEDSRIGSSHTAVPGPDGRYGFGGACFPKDTRALITEYPDFTILEEVVHSNNQIRSRYKLDPREAEQQVKFNR